MSSSRNYMKLKDIKRKHFRFPLYDDVASLKLKTKKSTRVIFAGDDFITNHVNDRPMIQKAKSAVVTSYDNDYVYKSKVSSSVKLPKMAVDSSNNEAMKISRPSSKRFAKLQEVNNKNVGVPIKKQSFYHAQDSTILKNRNLNKDIIAKKTDSQRDYISELQREHSKTIKQQYSGDVDRFRSRMKKVPSPLSKKREQTILTKDELISSMHKNLGSFILFDDEKTSKNLQNEQDIHQTSVVKADVNQDIKNKDKNKQTRVLNRSLAGIFAEESKGIDKVSNKFFTD